MQITINEIKQILLEEQLNEQRLIIEAIDVDFLKKLNYTLSKIDNISRKYELSSVQRAVKKASNIIDKSMNRGSIKNFFIQKLAPDFVKKHLSGITAISALEASLAQGFKSIPAIVSFAEQGNVKIKANEPIRNSGNVKRISNLLNKSFTPPDFLSSFWWGNSPPFLDKKDLINDILNLTMKQINSLIKDTQGLTSIPVEKDDVEQVANLSQKDDSFIKKLQVQPRPTPQKEKRKILRKKTLYNFIKNNMDVEEDEIVELITFLQKQGVSIS